MSNHRFCCCDGGGAPCENCRNPAFYGCGGALGYTAVTCNFDVKFKMEWCPRDCANFRFYDGPPADFDGTVASPVTLYSNCVFGQQSFLNCALQRGCGNCGTGSHCCGFGGTSLTSWPSVSEERCYGSPNPYCAFQPFNAVSLKCESIGGVRYGVCTIALAHRCTTVYGNPPSPPVGCGPFTINTLVRYRRPMNPDCKIDLGEYEYFETVRPDLYREDCSLPPYFPPEFIFSSPRIKDISPGTVFIS